jgi:1-pyrroline-5-carboxylate dehydrogenase
MSLMPYRPEPYVDFSQPGPAAAMKAALDKVRGELGRHYPLVIGGDPIVTEGRIVSVNPAKPSEVVGETSKADAALAASIFHYGTYTVGQLKEELRRAGIPVRTLS